MEGPLKGHRVVEVAFWAAVPAAGAILADWGAEVIKIEPPDGGDPVRTLTIGTMAAGAALKPPLELDHRNKRSAAIDLRRPEGAISSCGSSIAPIFS
jgi:crotonobetainyl-CoA:carnitine CoA-transferase CaiB-like acyl-CoA transferase